MSELWIPIIGMLCIAFVIIINLVLSARHKKELHKTLQKHLDSGGALTPSLLEQLGAVPSGRHGDLRKGVVLVAAGLACLAAGWVSHAFQLGAVFGIFPLFLGFAFFAAAHLNKNE